MCSSSRLYHDILAPRRQESSTFIWTSRELSPQYAFKQDFKPSPQWHKEEVLKSRKIQALLEQISEKQNVPKEQLEQQVKDILNEIGFNFKLKVVRWLGLFLVKICMKVSTGIYVSSDGLTQLQSRMGSCPIVFVPTHRSYADFILMSLVCYSEGFALPAIAAGMDFHGMWGMGTVLRDTGAFFMRRSYSDDQLYWTTFKQYVYQLTSKGELPIEFFIEGTRSRSCKALMPKYGLISMILKALFLSQVPDILFVPISINYDRIMEEKLFAFELLGIPKPKESTSGFFKSLKIVKEKFGKIYFDFATPISAKAFFGDTLDKLRWKHSLEPLHLQEITENEKQMIPPLAHEIIYKQQKHSVILPFNIIAILLNNNLTIGNGLLSISEMTQEMLWFGDVMRQFGAHVVLVDAKKDLMEAFETHHEVIRRNEEGKVTLSWNNIVLDKFDPHRLKAHALSEKTITFSVPCIMLQIYINPMLHYLIDAAILVIILKFRKLKPTQDELYGHFHFLRSLLSQEFVTYSTKERMEFSEALVNCMKLRVISRTNDVYEIGNNEKLEQILCTSLDCFLYTYYTVCRVILKETSGTCDEKSILVKTQAEIENAIYDEKTSVHPYSLNLDSITNCLNSLCTMGALKKTRRQRDIFYEINKNKMSFIKNELDEFTPNYQTIQKNMENILLQLKNKL